MARRLSTADASIVKPMSKAELARRAVEVRTELGLTEFVKLDPYALAEVYGIAVHQLHSLVVTGCPDMTVQFFTQERPEVWSAALVPDGTGHLIVENTAHQPQRRRSNIAHEMAHVVLEHTFDRILFAGDVQKGCVNPGSREQEFEAAELGAELLLPKNAAAWAARKGMADAQVAELFDVSVQLAAWRMNSTGARLRAQRAAAKRGGFTAR
ncbi:ImmA/IrrE family metallo-endopeptidase [Dactylosporangium sp. CA-139066]|uniref:ImmA/IrrE family metallo-endopeptidase n=1 Tax=Dactylosporangium sp. CA-139066 TaxID=3239930 RepID=UPI003D9428A3